MKSMLRIAGSVLVAVLAASAGLAQQRTFVSGAGSDANPCTFALPCRTFTKAESVTSAGGEVAALDAAQYDPFTITKAISIEAPAGASVSVPAGGDGVTISAPTGPNVALRGLTINAVGCGAFLNSFTPPQKRTVGTPGRGGHGGPPVQGPFIIHVR